MALSPTPDAVGVPVGAPVGVGAHHSPSHLDWAASFGGAAVATAIAYVLTTFGSALGLSLTSPFEGRGASTPVMLAAIGLWVIWVAASSFMAGGYVAGRMRRRLFDSTEHEVDVRDGIHGVVVWAVASLLGAALIAMTAAGTVKTGAQIATTVAQTAAVGGGAAAGMAADPLRGITDRMLRAGPQGPGADAGNSAETAAETGRILRNGLAAGDVPADDRAYLAQVVARNTGLSEDEARARVDQGIEQAKAAEQKAREAADKARKAAIVAAFGLAASLLIGAAAAMWGATMGGRHRDEGLVLNAWAWRR